MRIAIYTVIANNHTRLYDVTRFEDYGDVDFYCITDKVPEDTKGWKCLEVVPFPGKYGPTLTNRYYKLYPDLYFEEYDINVYLDATKVVFNLPLLLNYCAQLHGDDSTDAIFVKHHERNTVKEEAEEVIRCSRADPMRVQAQYKSYVEEGFPDNIPLAVCSVQIRKCNDSMTRFLKVWRDEIMIHCHRDQLSWPYAVWKCNMQGRYRMIDVFKERLKMIGNMDKMGPEIW